MGDCQMPLGEESVILWLDANYYLGGATLQPIWFNFQDEAIFLAGCNTYTIEEQTSDGWQELAPVVSCVWEGLAQKVDPSEALVVPPFTAPDLFLSASSYRLRGTIYYGCLDNEPISSAQCNGSAEVTREYSVGPPFP